MIRIERDPVFWASIAGHLQVAPHIGVGPNEVAEFVQRPGVTPLAAEHGGFLFSNLDGLGFIVELHTLFTPEAWDTREITISAHAAFRLIFGRGIQVVLTYQQEAWARSAPPKSHGWIVAGDYRGSAIGALRMWVLTVDAWRASPAVRRNQLCH